MTKMNTENMNVEPGGREPIFNLPPAIATFAVLLLGIHILRQCLGTETDQNLLLHFAFIPSLLGGKLNGLVPVEAFSPFWSPVTYAFLHGGWDHVVLNTLWLVVFGTPVSHRFGALRFILFCLLLAPVGALAHYMAVGPLGAPIIGASAIVSGLTAASIRFAFDDGGSIMRQGDNAQRFRQPAHSLIQNLQNRQVLIFIAVWLGINLIFGLGGSTLGPEGTSIAWQAHLGGFIAGLVFFPIFDPIGRKTA